MGDVIFLRDNTAACHATSFRQILGTASSLQETVGLCADELRIHVDKLEEVLAKLGDTIGDLPVGNTRQGMELSKSSILLQLESVRLILATL